MGVFTLVVTSGVIPVPPEWMSIPRLRVAISVDGLPEHHDIRRKPATYERILKNIEGREVNIHWVITRQMLERPGYLEEYVAFWNARPEVNRIWVSVYTPQVGEHSAEMLTSEDREALARQLPALTEALSQAFVQRRTWLRRFFSRRRIRAIAFLRRCRRTIQRISRAAWNRAFSAGRRTARSADARRAWECIGSGRSKLPAD